MIEKILLGFSKTELIAYAALILGFSSVLMVVLKNKMGERAKKIFFFTIATVIVLVTIYLDASTIYANLKSVTNGPVHWHASIEFLICGNNFELAHREIAVDKPLHTHSDGIIHVETTPLSWEDVQLKKFFEYIGGKFTKTSLSFPSDSGMLNVKNGDMCRGKPSTIKMFVNGKLEPKMDEYVISPVEAGNIDKILIVVD